MHRSSSIASVIGGSVSRSMAAIVTAPLELMRTRAQVWMNGWNCIMLCKPQVISTVAFQSIHPSIHPYIQIYIQALRSHHIGLMEGMSAIVKAGGIISLWHGLGAQLWRDVPFRLVHK